MRATIPPAVDLRLVVAVYAGLLGLVVGSYLNVVIYRLPRGISTVLPRSRCPACGSPVAARDNLPVMSFLLLGGRCRRCGAPIAWRYPLVELITGVLFAAAALHFGPNPAAGAAAVFCALLIALGAIDLEHLLLPDRLTLPGMAAGLFLHRWLVGGGLADAVAGAALGGGVLLAIWALWYLVRREEGVGLGDVKMLAMIGAFVGWRGVVVTFVVAVVAGAAIGVALVALRAGGRRTRLPFGAFLAAGGLVALFWGPAIADAYAGLV